MILVMGVGRGWLVILGCVSVLMGFVVFILFFVGTLVIVVFIVFCGFEVVVVLGVGVKVNRSWLFLVLLILICGSLVFFCVLSIIRMLFSLVVRCVWWMLLWFICRC